MMRARKVSVAVALTVMLVGGIGTAEAKKPMRPRPAQPLATTLVANRPLPAACPYCGYGVWGRVQTTLSATLVATESGSPVPDKTVVFSTDQVWCSAVTDLEGHATCQAWVPLTDYTATFAGDDSHLAAEDEASLVNQ